MVETSEDGEEGGEEAETPVELGKLMEAARLEGAEEAEAERQQRARSAGPGFGESLPETGKDRRRAQRVTSAVTVKPAMSCMEAIMAPFDRKWP